MHCSCSMTALVCSTSRTMIYLESNASFDLSEFLISDLALASYSVPSFTLSSLSLLSSVVESHQPAVIITDAGFLNHLLELLYDSNENENHTIVVVGDVDPARVSGLRNMKVLHWDDLERQGSALDKNAVPSPGQFVATSCGLRVSHDWLDPNDVVTVAFFETPSGQVDGVQLTHQNLTAGVAAARALVPPSSAISPLDTILSAYSLSTPYGRVVAYTALFEGTSFATVDSTKLIKADDGLCSISYSHPPVSHTNTLFPAPSVSGLKDLRTSAAYRISSPTILFIRPDHLSSLSDAILNEARTSSWLLFNFAWRHKLAGILEGYMTKQSLWDRLVFDAARVKVMGKGAGTVRAVVVSGGTSSSSCPARLPPLSNLSSAYRRPARGTGSDPFAHRTLCPSHQRALAPRRRRSCLRISPPRPADLPGQHALDALRVRRGCLCVHVPLPRRPALRQCGGEAHWGGRLRRRRWC